MGVVSILRYDKNIVVLVVVEGAHLYHFEIAHTNVFCKALGHNKVAVCVDFPSEFLFLVYLTGDINRLI